VPRRNLIALRLNFTEPAQRVIRVAFKFETPHGLRLDLNMRRLALWRAPSCGCKFKLRFEILKILTRALHVVQSENQL